MKYLFMFISLLLMLYPMESAAQYVDETLREEAEKLSMMTGQWEGSGWMMMQDGTKTEFDQTEDVYLKLNNTLLVIEGRGVSLEDGSLIHDAFAVIKYLPEEGLYRFESFLSNGKGTITRGKLKNDHTFTWWMDQPNGARILYTIDFSEEGKWKEVGEYLPDAEVENGNKFFEMTLTRIH